MVYIVEDILRKTGDLADLQAPEEAPKEEPTSAAPPMSDEEEADLEADFEKSLGAEEEQELEEVINISNEIIGKLLA